ncbi:MAG: FIST C-terminal domain-containing protein [Bacteroidetes bacterium]|nr:FIST C-terminal domain-containing protein [Bacteroidota bacterium]
MYIREKEISRITEQMETIAPSEGEILMVMIAEKEHPDLEELVSAMNRKNWKFIGGIFPGILYGNEKFEEGVLVSRLPVVSEPVIVKNMGDDGFMFRNHESIVKSGDKLTAVVLLDGLASNISHFLSNLYHKLGNSVNYIGGGAGSMSLQQQPCLITNQGIHQDAAVVAIINSPGRLGVQHGWARVDGPFIATKTHKNTIYELNWKNAFSVYKEVVENDSGRVITGENFFDVSKAYPFGISRERTECIVRDPITVNDDGALVCVGEVPENSVLAILRGESTLLTEAARNATLNCLETQSTANHAIVFDCISRVLFLQDAYNTEINEVHNAIQQANPGLLLKGALTLGEIAAQQGYLEFLNKTIVVGLLD